jgi:hypothetical protein
VAAAALVESWAELMAGTAIKAAKAMENNAICFFIYLSCLSF